MFTDSVTNQAKEAFDARKNDSEIKPSDLNGIRILGQGSYGKVTLVRHALTGKAFALKQITKESVKRKEQERNVQLERKLLAAVHHPFVCNLVSTFKNSHSVYMLMEPVMGGELYTHIRNQGRGRGLSLEETVFYAAQVTLVLEHLHAKKVVFRDLKPENLLVGRDGYLKMVDFGLSKFVSAGEKTYTLCGTPAYASPEVYACLGHDKGVDWWCLGVLIHEIHAGYTPFAGRSADEVSEEVGRYAHAYPNVAYPSKFPMSCSKLLKGLLNPDPSERLGNLRGGARDVKAHEFFDGVPWKDLVSKSIEAPWKPDVKDTYDSSNFRDRGKQTFELEIEADSDAINHESWCADF